MIAYAEIFPERFHLSYLYSLREKHVLLKNSLNEEFQKTFNAEKIR